MKHSEKLDRLTFLKQLGFGGASLMAVLMSCENAQPTPTSSSSTSSTTGTTTTGTTTSGTTTSGTTSTGTTSSGTTASGSTSSSKLTLDMSTSAYSKLLTAGQYVIVNSIVVACVSAGKYAAVTQVCSHEGRKQVYYSNGIFVCSAHGAQFSTTGAGLNSAGRNGLTTYNVSVNNNVLTIG